MNEMREPSVPLTKGVASNCLQHQGSKRWPKASAAAVARSIWNQSPLANDLQENRISRGKPMATHQTRAQKETVTRVMHEFKHGELESSSGQKVKNPKQAIAIGLREAGASKYESKKKNRANLKRTKVRERQAATRQDRTERARDRQKTRAELYAEARRRGVSGRSKMTKRELQHALD
jgi:MoxR-like ATPase